MIWTALHLPSLDEVIAYANAMYQVHGYWVVFIAALMEGCLLLNWYLPGSMVIIIGTLFAIEGGQSIAITIALVNIAFFIMAIFNYVLGRYGWYKLLLRFGLESEIDKVKRRIEKYGLIIMVISYVHPHTGSLVATSAGILQMKPKVFIKYTALAYLIWSTFWTAFAYFVGPQFLAMLDFKLLLILVAIWVFVMGFQYMWNIWSNQKLVCATVVSHRKRISSL